MNNKGFAITGILYGLMVLFMMLMLSFLSVLTAKKNKLEAISNSIDDSITMSEDIDVAASSLTTYKTKYRGNYVFTINSNTNECSVYLPSNAEVTISSGKIIVNGKDITITDCDNTGVSSFSLKKVYRIK
jgi:uncharacterized protein YpmB